MDDWGISWEINIDSGNGLVPSGNKSLPVPMLTKSTWPYGVSTPQWVNLILQYWHEIDGLVQDCSISIANALEILQSCTMPSKWTNTKGFNYIFHQILFNKFIKNCTWNHILPSSRQLWYHSPSILTRITHASCLITKIYIPLSRLITINYIQWDVIS